MIRRFALILLAPLALAGLPHHAFAASACAGAKLKAAAKSASCQLGLDANEVKKNVLKDPLKVAKCQANFAKAFAKAEAKGGCLTTGDAGPVDSAVAAFVADVDVALSLGAPNKCQAGKIKAAAKKASCKTTLQAKRAAKGTPIDPLKWAKCESAFDATYAKLEAKGGCATTGDAAAVEATVDGFVDDVESLLVPGLPAVGIAPILHVDPSDAQNLTLNGADVDGATDLSGAGNHMVLTSEMTNKPTFANDGIVAGRGAIRFANAKALVVDPGGPLDVSTFTAFVVFRAASYDTWNFVMGDDNYTWSSGWGLEANDQQLGAFAYGGPAERVAVVTDTTYVAAVVYDGAAIVSYLNGVLQTTDTSVSGFDPAPFRFSIGNSDYFYDTWGLDGWIGEVVFFPGVLSATDRDAVTQYLTGRWG